METVTANQLAARLGVDYVVASSLLKVMVAQGAAKEAGKVKTSATGKGKPSTLFSIPETFTLNLKPTAKEVPAPVVEVAEPTPEPVVEVAEPAVVETSEPVAAAA